MKIRRRWVQDDPRYEEVGHVEYQCDKCGVWLGPDRAVLTELPRTGVFTEVHCFCGWRAVEFCAFQEAR